MLDRFLEVLVTVRQYALSLSETITKVFLEGVLCWLSVKHLLALARK